MLILNTWILVTMTVRERKRLTRWPDAAKAAEKKLFLIVRVRTLSEVISDQRKNGWRRAWFLTVFFRSIRKEGALTFLTYEKGDRSKT